MDEPETRMSSLKKMLVKRLKFTEAVIICQKKWSGIWVRIIGAFYGWRQKPSSNTNVMLSWRRSNKSNKIYEEKPVRSILDPDHHTERCIEERLLSLGIAGLGPQLLNILIHAFSTRSASLEKLKILNLTHVRGLLLYGPTGCGKTILAKHFWKFIPAKEPLLVDACDVIGVKNGQQMKQARAFIKKAIKDEKKYGTQSDMYVVVLDGFIDLVARKNKMERCNDDSEELLEQLIELMDGPDALNNIFVIATTDREDLIDEDILSQGRFELQVKLDYPTERQRLQILELSTKGLREIGMLDTDVNLPEIASRTSGRSGAFLYHLPSRAHGNACTMNMLETGRIEDCDCDKVKMCNFNNYI